MLQFLGIQIKEQIKALFFIEKVSKIDFWTLFVVNSLNTGEKKNIKKKHLFKFGVANKCIQFLNKTCRQLNLQIFL